MSYAKYATQFEYDEANRKAEVRRIKAKRRWRRGIASGRIRVVAKPGVRPLSRLHPDHPVHLANTGPEYWDAYMNRDKTRWE